MGWIGTYLWDGYRHICGMDRTVYFVAEVLNGRSIFFWEKHKNNVGLIHTHICAGLSAGIFCRVFCRDILQEYFAGILQGYFVGKKVFFLYH